MVFIVTTHKQQDHYTTKDYPATPLPDVVLTAPRYHAPDGTLSDTDNPLEPHIS